MCRKVLRERLEAERTSKDKAGNKLQAQQVLSADQIETYAGVRRYSYGLAEQEDQVVV